MVFECSDESYGLKKSTGSSSSISSVLIVKLPSDSSMVTESTDDMLKLYSLESTYNYC